MQILQIMLISLSKYCFHDNNMFSSVFLLGVHALKIIEYLVRVLTNGLVSKKVYRKSHVDTSSFLAQNPPKYHPKNTSFSNCKIFHTLLLLLLGIDNPL